jgi:hypothetical protein
LAEKSDRQRPYFTWLKLTKENTGVNQKVTQKGKTDKVTEVEILKGTKMPDRYKIAVGVDLGGVLTSNKFKMDAKNYLVDSRFGFAVESIKPVGQCSEDVFIKENVAGRISHVIFLVSKPRSEIQKLPGNTDTDFIKISLKAEQPDWIEYSNSDDDSNVNSEGFSRTTFSLKSMLNGIDSAYFYGQKDVCYFDIGIKLEIK